MMPPESGRSPKPVRQRVHGCDRETAIRGGIRDMPTATEEATAIQELGWKRHFVGPEGVRAGWRLLIFFALLGFMLGATWPLRRLNHLLLQGLPSLIQVVDAGIR